MLVNGREIAQQINEKTQKYLSDLPVKKVCFVLFGNDEASLQFIRIKTRVAESMGIQVTLAHYTDSVDTHTACQRVTEICEQGNDGVIIQLPLPVGLDTQVILDSVPLEQDIDVLSTRAYELFKTTQSVMIPPVAAAVWEILMSLCVSLLDKNIVIIGQGGLVGKPVGDLFMREKIPYKIIDKDTDTTERMKYLQQADIIISGAGIPHMITPDMITAGVILIDAGTSEQRGELVGDIHPGCVEV
jgi:methylenetetrahydrofolate dehydrogenase (NADP+)/methenyltetrahydrofolate cyclohydrolase